VKYEYDMLKTNAQVCMYNYLRTKQPHYLVTAIAETRMALAVHADRRSRFAVRQSAD